MMASHDKAKPFVRRASLIKPEMNVFDTFNRLGFGAGIPDLERFKMQHIMAWLDEQLHPDDKEDQVCQKRLSELRIPIRYGKSKDWPAVDEMRPVQYLNAEPEELVVLTAPGKSRSYQELQRPRVEVAIATLLRAVYSRWQLREVLVDFWHNHFNVNAWDQNIGLLFPVYDRSIIRQYCLGNFRQMLEAVAQSTSMLTYLNNRSSRTGAPNENYARELFELHTMGEDAYMNSLYNRWRQVPGAPRGKPEGYIDQDVYEAARAFTGWAVADGTRISGDEILPRTGRFAYVPSWHDNYQKRVLACEFDPYQPEMVDGRKVLDLLSSHAATAHYLAKKLCLKLVSDNPSESLIKSAAKIWKENQHQNDQIARVVHYIASSPEFLKSRGAKTKRPLELMASFVRGTGFDFTPTEALINQMAAGGQRIFGWPTPDGHPMKSDYWLGSNAMRQRWILIYGLASNQFGNGVMDPIALVSAQKMTAGTFTDTWIKRLYGRDNPRLTKLVLSSASYNPDTVITRINDARKIVTWLAMAPEYQRC